MRVSTKRTNYIREDQIKAQQQLFKRLYKEYKVKLKKLSPTVQPESFRYFKTILQNRPQGRSIKHAITLSVSKTAGILTRSQAINLKAQATQLGIDVSGMKLDQIRRDKDLQHTIYEIMKSQGLSSEELSDWWSENIIGSP